MLISHQEKNPVIDPSAYVAPNAVLCGDVRIGKNVRILFGAQLIAENAAITIGDNSIVLENAVIRGTKGFPVAVGSNCLVGPNTHLAGCTLEENVFVATGASVFHGATLKAGSEVRINGVVHLKTVLPAGEFVPIGWVAVGDPVRILPPDRHEEIWEVQGPLNFPLHVYGIDRPKPGDPHPMIEICRVMGERLGWHSSDGVIPNKE